MDLPQHHAAEPELLDVVDATGRPLGVAPRSDVHREGRWHNVFHCLVVRPNLPATVVLQRRAATKSAFPNKLDFSATGHLTAGESPEDGVRELNEELGIDARSEQLVPAGVRLLADDQGEGLNRERVHAFYMQDARPLEAYQPAEREVDGLVEAPVAGLLALLDGTVERIDAQESRHCAAPQSVTVTLEDLVNPADGYWVVALTMAERLAEGRGPIRV